MHIQPFTGRMLFASVAALAASMASGQCPDNPIDNASFETPSAANPSQPDGWAIFNTAQRRTATDGITPFFARTGDASMEFPSGTDFSGVTTDVLDPVTLEFNNPPYVWQGGDVTITGWYLIPADMPLDGASSGIKLEFRRANSSIYASFEELSVTGDTNGEWVEFSLTVTNDDLLSVGDFPPYPVAVTVLPLRFGDSSSTGTVFWDDLCLVQVTEEPCLADTNGDGSVTPADFNAWIVAFNAQTPACDQNGDGDCTPADFNAWISNFNAGCP